MASMRRPHEGQCGRRGTRGWNCRRSGGDGLGNGLARGHRTLLVSVLGIVLVLRRCARVAASRGRLPASRGSPRRPRPPSPSSSGRTASPPSPRPLPCASAACPGHRPSGASAAARRGPPAGPFRGTARRSGPACPRPRRCGTRTSPGRSGTRSWPSRTSRPPCRSPAGATPGRASGGPSTGPCSSVPSPLRPAGCAGPGPLIAAGRRHRSKGRLSGSYPRLSSDSSAPSPCPREGRQAVSRQIAARAPPHRLDRRSPRRHLRPERRHDGPPRRPRRHRHRGLPHARRARPRQGHQRRDGASRRRCPKPSELNELIVERSDVKAAEVRQRLRHPRGSGCPVPRRRRLDPAGRARHRPPGGAPPARAPARTSS